MAAPVKRSVPPRTVAGSTAGGAGHRISEVKRRLKSLLDVSGLFGRLAVTSAEPATVDDLLRVHTDDASGGSRRWCDHDGEIGPEALFSRGGFDINFAVC